MKKALSLQAFSLSKQLAFTALFAALCCVGTIVISIPLPFGYFNVGDVFVLLSGWCLGPLYGSIAAAVGSALADIIGGYPIYAPATFLIKGVDAFIAYMVWVLLKKFIKKESLDFLPRLGGAVLGETWMIFGYFLYEGILYGFVAATGTLLGNFLQGIFCLVCGVALIAALYPIKAVRGFFPALCRDSAEKQQENKSPEKKI